MPCSAIFLGEYLQVHRQVNSKLIWLRDPRQPQLLGLVCRQNYCKMFTVAVLTSSFFAYILVGSILLAQGQHLHRKSALCLQCTDAGNRLTFFFSQFAQDRLPEQHTSTFRADAPVVELWTNVARSPFFVVSCMISCAVVIASTILITNKQSTSRFCTNVMTRPVCISHPDGSSIPAV